MVIGVAAAVAVLVMGGLTGHVRRAVAQPVDCAAVKCVALTFDDGPSPYTDRLLKILTDDDAHATFFLIATRWRPTPQAPNASPARAWRSAATPGSTPI
jgi:peptidoglycan/xylan/chitin deacetylase (PgdA/CDA1 family)